jgi:L-gulono-1,4-lactone dehydrogenase
MPIVANWCGRVVCAPSEVLRPTSEPELCRIVQRARREGRRVKVVGARHSFSRIWTTDEVLVDLGAFHRVLEVDRARMQVTVQGGMPLHRFVAVLARFGMALPNIGAWMEQTVAGVYSTATHGTSGRYRRTLPEAVIGLRMVDGTGEPRTLEGAALRFATLGMFGIVTSVTLQCRPFFHVEQQRRVLSRDEAIDFTMAALELHDFVDLRWAGAVPGAMVGLWDEVAGRPGWRDRTRAAAAAARRWAVNRAVATYPAARLPHGLNIRVWHALGGAHLRGAELQPRVLPWHRGLTFDALGFAPPHDEIELALPRDQAPRCLREVSEHMLHDPRSASIEVQVRFSAAIDMALAPNDGRETAWLNLNVFDAEVAAPVVDALTRIAYRYDARAHWAKIIPAHDEDPAARHPGLSRWEHARARFDPDGVFRNAWYDRYFARAPCRPVPAEPSPLRAA